MKKSFVENNIISEIKIIICIKIRQNFHIVTNWELGFLNINYQQELSLLENYHTLKLGKDNSMLGCGFDQGSLL